MEFYITSIVSYYNIGKNTFCQSKYLSVHHSLIQTLQNKGVEFKFYNNNKHNKL